jgi:hypothetical protein
LVASIFASAYCRREGISLGTPNGLSDDSEML